MASHVQKIMANRSVVRLLVAVGTVLLLTGCASGNSIMFGMF